MIGAIAARELRGLFLSPLAWAILAAIQLVLGYVFLVQVEVFLQWQGRLAAIEGAVDEAVARSGQGAEGIDRVFLTGGTAKDFR